jgi:hypothetical protein
MFRVAVAVADHDNDDVNAHVEAHDNVNGSSAAALP